MYALAISVVQVSIHLIPVCILISSPVQNSPKLHRTQSVCCPVKSDGLNSFSFFFLSMYTLLWLYVKYLLVSFSFLVRSTSLILRQEKTSKHSSNWSPVEGLWDLQLCLLAIFYLSFLLDLGSYGPLFVMPLFFLDKENRTIYIMIKRMQTKLASLKWTLYIQCGNYSQNLRIKRCKRSYCPENRVSVRLFLKHLKQTHLFAYDVI